MGSGIHSDQHNNRCTNQQKAETLMTNNRMDQLFLGEALAGYQPADTSEGAQRTYNKLVSRFQIDRQLATSWCSLGDASGQSLTAIWIEDNPVGAQVVSLWRERGERVFIADFLPLWINDEGRIAVTEGEGRLVGAWPVAQLTESARDVVKSASRTRTADGGFWQYETIGWMAMADFEQLEAHYQDIRNGLANAEARALFGFGRPANDDTPLGGEDDPSAYELFS